MIRQLQIHVFEVVRLVLLIKLFAQTDEQVVVLDWVSDGGQLLWNLALIKQVRHFRPVVLVLCAESVRETARVVI